MKSARRLGVPRKPTDPPAGCVVCDENAVITEWVSLYTGSTAFYPYCACCWHSPAANGGPSAAERTGVNATVGE
jgi:hypothetical protein